MTQKLILLSLLLLGSWCRAGEHEKLRAESGEPFGESMSAASVSGPMVVAAEPRPSAPETPIRYVEVSRQARPEPPPPAPQPPAKPSLLKDLVDFVTFGPREGNFVEEHILAGILGWLGTLPGAVVVPAALVRWLSMIHPETPWVLLAGAAALGSTLGLVMAIHELLQNKRVSGRYSGPESGPSGGFALLGAACGAMLGAGLPFVLGASVGKAAGAIVGLAAEPPLLATARAVRWAFTDGFEALLDRIPVKR